MEDSQGGLSRRDLLKRGAMKTGAAAGILIGAGSIKEIITPSTIETPTGRFTGLYEIHTESYKRDHLPLSSDTSAIFREEASSLANIIANPDKIICASDKEFGSKEFPDKTLLEAAQKQIPLMFGDVTVNFTTEILTSLGVNGSELILGALSLDKLSELKKEEAKLEKAKVNKRREVLKAGLALGGVWGLSDTAKIPLMLAQGIPGDVARKLESQVSNIISGAHPEDIIVFFRNALIANKLLYLSELQQQQLGRKPHLVYNVGYGHRGIEDFLQAGRDFCRSVILAYPAPFLRYIGDQTGGIDMLSSSLLYQLPKDLTESDIKSQKLRGKSTVINDPQLKQGLAAKLK